MNLSERTTWEQRRYAAKKVLEEIAPTRKKLKEIYDAYDRIFCREFIKYREADERLAAEDGRLKRYKTITPTDKQHGRKLHDYTPEELLRMMSRDQIIRLQSAVMEMRGDNDANE